MRELSALDALPGRGRFVVVASHGHFEVEALEWALRGHADYVGLVTSQRRLPDVLERLRERGLGADHLAPLRAPAGLTIGATGPEEVALSVLAEIVAQRRGPRATRRIRHGAGRDGVGVVAHRPSRGARNAATRSLARRELGRSRRASARVAATWLTTCRRPSLRSPCSGAGARTGAPAAELLRRG